MTHRTWTSAAAVLIALTLGPTAVFAQGVQTGIITGTLTSEDGLSLPGATVTGCVGWLAAIVWAGM